MFPIEVFLVAIPAVLIVGISKGGFANSVGVIATPLIALVLDPAQALGLMLPLLSLADMAALRAYWRKWSLADGVWLIVGALPGAVLGIALYRVASPDVFRFLIGLIALGFVLFQVARARGLIRPPSRQAGPVGGAVAGTVAGFTSFVSHAGGPPVAIYLLSRRLEKTVYQATSVVVFTSINAMKFVPYAYLGMFTRETLIADLVLAPVMVLGVVIGVWAHRKIPERLFFGVAYVFLTITGAKLIWDALT